MSRRIHWLLLFSLISLASLGQLARAQHGITWQATYYRTQFLDHNAAGSVTRQEGTLNFQWPGNGGAIPGFPEDNWSARFTTSHNFEAGRYRFEFRVDDDFNFYIDGQLVIETWDKGQSGTTQVAERDLSAGNHSLRVDYKDYTGAGSIQFDWSRVDGGAPAADAPAAAPTPFVYYARPVPPQPARADGSIVHVVKAGDTVNAIAVAYQVEPSAIVERNQLAGNGRWIYPGQELVIRDATALGGSTLTPVDTQDDESDTPDTPPETTATEPDEQDGPSSATILTDSDVELRAVQIDSTCLSALRRGYDVRYGEDDVVKLAHFEVAELSIRGVTPHDWEGEPLGIMARGNLLLDPSAIIHHVEPEMNFNEFVREVLPQYGFATDLPPATCIQQLSTTDFWLFYVFPEAQIPVFGEVIQVLALLERDGMSMIALLAHPEDPVDYLALLETAFLPAVWNYEYGSVKGSTVTPAPIETAERSEDLTTTEEAPMLVQLYNSGNETFPTAARILLREDYLGNVEIQVGDVTCNIYEEDLLASEWANITPCISSNDPGYLNAPDTIRVETREGVFEPTSYYRCDEDTNQQEEGQRTYACEFLEKR